MGTSLTGLTPATTYDALIKVGDNGPLSGSQKRISDGLGNDSAMSLSTSGVRVDGSALFEQSSASVAMTVSSGWGGGFDNPIMNFGRIGLAVNGQLGYDDPNTLLYIGTTTSHAFSIRTNNTERIRITPAGNVGIGTATPSQNLSVEENTLNPSLISLTGSFGTARGAVISLAADNLGANESALKFTTQTSAPYGGYVFSNQGGELLRVMSSGGITFNGDTAAANALDDYEEGTFTATVAPVASGSITLSTSECRYTKIGRQVFVQSFLTVASVSSPTGVAVAIQGLPFTIANATSAGGGCIVTFADSSASYAKTAVPSFYLSNNTQVLAQIDASTIASGDEFFLGITYTV